MTTEIFPAQSRGTADYGWLQANFSFSFGSYYNPDNVQFGMLRVLNDDTIAAGMGFGTHSHDNMEIVTIPLEGGLMHRDSIGNSGVIQYGEVQVMSAGRGVQHSEMNASETKRAKTLQLWVFPDKENVNPRYDQKAFDLEANRNRFTTVVSPQDKIENGSLWIHQDAYFSLGLLDEGQSIAYSIHSPGNGVYAFVLEGEVTIAGQLLGKRDAVGITETESFGIQTHSASKILLVEVPMEHH